MAHKRPHEFFEKKKTIVWTSSGKENFKEENSGQIFNWKTNKKILNGISPGKVKNKRGWYKTYCTWKIRKEIIRKQK